MARSLAAVKVKLTSRGMQEDQRRSTEEYTRVCRLSEGNRDEGAV